MRFQVEPFITDADQHVREASASPDNTRIAYRRGRGDIMVMDIGTRESTCVIPGWDPAIDFRWSPDGKFIAYSQDDQDNNRDVWIIPADASKQQTHNTTSIDMSLMFSPIEEQPPLTDYTLPLLLKVGVRQIYLPYCMTTLHQFLKR